MDNDKISNYTARAGIQDIDASPQVGDGSGTRYFDIMIYVIGGSTFGSAAVGILANLAHTPDTDATRIIGMVIGAALLGFLRAKKKF